MLPQPPITLLFKACLETHRGLFFLLSFPPRFISHGISHCYSSFRGDVRGKALSFYWTYLLSVFAGGGAWLLLWATVDRCGRRGILLLSMTMTGLASLILLGLMNCKRALLWFPSSSRVTGRKPLPTSSLKSPRVEAFIGIKGLALSNPNWNNSKS